MSFLLDKSNQNQFAALKLFDQEKKYAPSVHCAYYSCIQLMIHILITAGKKTETQIQSEIGKGNSHQYYIYQTQNLIKAVLPSEVLKFDEIKDLKSYRTSSDYKNKEITSVDSEKAINIAERINTLLKRTFNIA